MKKIFLLTGLALAANAFAQIPTNGLIGYWPFTGNANDLSGNAYNGTVNGATLTTDRFGNANSAYSFDGISNYISTANINLHDTGTISVWVNPYLKAAGNNGFTYSASLVDENMDASGNSGYGLYYNDSLNNGLYAHVGYSGNSNTTVLSHIDLSLHAWHHCVLTLNNGTGKLYLDGNLIYTQTGLSSTSQTSTVLLFGKGPWASNANLFKGKLDDIRIYNRTLTSLEVNSLFNEGICYNTIYDTITTNITVYDTITTNITIYDTVIVNHTNYITVTDTLIINVLLTGINPPDNTTTLNIYPNPAKDHITINYGNYTSLSGYTLKIVNALSQTVFTTSISQQTSYINLSSWTGKGVYFVHLIDANDHTVDIRKVVLQ